nr:RNA-directed DNA polymerase, eukaryota [Tanacetum cinerariifolium]
MSRNSKTENSAYSCWLDNRAKSSTSIPVEEVSSMQALKQDASNEERSLSAQSDENSKYFHGIINKKRSHLAIRGVFNDGIWRTDPSSVKKAFRDHYEARFNKPTTTRLKLSFPFPERLAVDQVDDFEGGVSHDEIRSAVWYCGDNKSPGPDGFTFEFFKKYWRFIGPDFCEAVEHFFTGFNSSFIALIPKVMDSKFVNDYRPISLIGSVYKVVTKILANRLATVIAGLVSDTQSTFLVDRQILDDPFILNEVLDWCKRKNKQAMFFKVDFAKAYDSVRWDFLIDVLEAFGFGSTWCNWIRGTFCYAKASILVNGNPSDEFHLHCDLKQGDPLSPYLFILVMESLHLSISRAVDEGVFKGIQLHGSLSLSHNLREARIAIDDMALPSHPEPTRWVKFIPIKINIFVWRARRDCLPTRHNLVHKGVVLESTSCPVCLLGVEDVHHILFRCSLAQEVLHRVCRWWEMDFRHLTSFSEREEQWPYLYMNYNELNIEANKGIGWNGWNSFNCSLIGSSFDCSLIGSSFDCSLIGSSLYVSISAKTGNDVDLIPSIFLSNKSECSKLLARW